MKKYILSLAVLLLLNLFFSALSLTQDDEALPEETVNETYLITERPEPKLEKKTKKSVEKKLKKDKKRHAKIKKRQDKRQRKQQQ